MLLSEVQAKKIREYFDALDRKWSLEEVNNEKWLFLFGMMSAFRETLEKKELEMTGITGLWWLENETNQIPRSDELKQEITKEAIEIFSRGYKAGENELLRLLQI